MSSSSDRTRHPSASASLKVLVIGGGVAGSSCALRLSQLGVEVHLAERSAFPRGKACGCCIGGAGLAQLEMLGLRQQAERSGALTNRWIASIGSRNVQLSLPPGLAISRRALDPMLLSAAADAGTTVHHPCHAVVLDDNADGVNVELKTENDSALHTFDVVVVAAGLSAGGLADRLPWIETPHGPFGLSTMMEIPEVETGAIYMACDEDGYVGLVRLGQGQVDVAAALRSGASFARLGSPLDRVKSIIDRSQFSFTLQEPTGKIHTTPPMRRSRLPGRGRVIAVGDAAGYSEPFTGEGMTWALQSAISAAGLIAEIRDANDDTNDLGRRWNKALPKLLGRKTRLCRAITSGLTSPILRRSAAELLTWMPGLASPIVRSLAR